MIVCPVCSGVSFSKLSSREGIREEIRFREKFIRERLSRPLNKDESKDLTDFFHSEEAEIRQCESCTLLIRRQCERPETEEYAADAYNPAVMEQQYPQYLDAFRRKETPYRDLLASTATVLEVGSHYGAFLQVAREWGWQAEGVDVGKDTSRFASSKGFVVHQAELQQCGFGDASFDGVFIWNCFEQIEDPTSVLREARRLTKPGGLLVLRTPNGLFYATCQSLLRDSQLGREGRAFLLEALGYNNLLGFPYLYGHSRSTLVRLLEPYGFNPEGVLNSELLTLPVPDKSSSVEKEEQMINAEMRLLANSILASSAGALTGPWIEMWFRAA